MVRPLSKEQLLEIKEFAQFFNELLPDLGRNNVVKKMLDIDNFYIIAKYKSKVVGACIFKPHPDKDFIELFYLGVNPKCHRSVSRLSYA